MMVRSIVFLFAALTLAACQTTSQATPEEVARVEAERIEYRLGSGDQVRVIVFGEQGLSGEFFVDGGGRVSMPLIGEVQAGGRTIPEFEQAVVASLSEGYLNDPRVSVEVMNFRPYYILGEVEVAGEYPYTDGLTIMNAVATAGGFTYRANTRIVHVKRAGETEFVQMPLTAITPVHPGDTIRIAERFF